MTRRARMCSDCDVRPVTDLRTPLALKLRALGLCYWCHLARLQKGQTMPSNLVVSCVNCNKRAVGTGATPSKLKLCATCYGDPTVRAKRWGSIGGQARASRRGGNGHKKAAAVTALTRPAAPAAPAEIAPPAAAAPAELRMAARAAARATAAGILRELGAELATVADEITTARSA